MESQLRCWCQQALRALTLTWWRRWTWHKQTQCPLTLLVHVCIELLWWIWCCGSVTSILHVSFSLFFFATEKLAYTTARGRRHQSFSAALVSVCFATGEVRQRFVWGSFDGRQVVGAVAPSNPSSRRHEVSPSILRRWKLGWLGATRHGVGRDQRMFSLPCESFWGRILPDLPRKSQVGKTADQGENLDDWFTEQGRQARYQNACQREWHHQAGGVKEWPSSVSRVCIVHICNRFHHIRCSSLVVSQRQGHWQTVDPLQYGEAVEQNIHPDMSEPSPVRAGGADRSSIPDSDVHLNQAGEQDSHSVKRQNGNWATPNEQKKMMSEQDAESGAKSEKWKGKMRSELGDAMSERKDEREKTNTGRRGERDRWIHIQRPRRCEEMEGKRTSREEEKG